RSCNAFRYQKVIVCMVEGVAADRVMKSTCRVGERAPVGLSPVIANRQALLHKSLRHLLRVVARGIVGDHDLVGKIKLVVRLEAAERVAQEGSAIERRDANAELDVAHPGPAFEFGSYTRRENHPSKAKSRSCPRTCAAGKAPKRAS